MLGRPAGYLDGLRAVAVGIAANQSLVTGLPVRVDDLDLGVDLSRAPREVTARPRPPDRPGLGAKKSAAA